MILTPQPHRLVRNPNQVLSINNVPILKANNFQFLGINLPHNLSWKCHIDMVRDKLRICLGIIYKGRGYLNTGCLLSILYSLATTHLIYCITTCNSALTSKLRSLYNRILRLIFHHHPLENIDDIYKNLALPRVKDKHKVEICNPIYKFLHQMLPECFNNFFPTKLRCSFLPNQAI